MSFVFNACVVIELIIVLTHLHVASRQRFSQFYVVRVAVKSQYRSHFSFSWEPDLDCHGVHARPNDFFFTDRMIEFLVVR